MDRLLGVGLSLPLPLAKSEHRGGWVPGGRSLCLFQGLISVLCPQLVHWSPIRRTQWNIFLFQFLLWFTFMKHWFVQGTALDTRLKAESGEDIPRNDTRSNHSRSALFTEEIDLYIDSARGDGKRNKGVLHILSWLWKSQTPNCQVRTSLFQPFLE